MSKTNKLKTNKKGSLTVEAAIVMPLFFCVIVSVVFFIKAIHAHEVLQYALDRTANE
ncbi:MAG: pilus assembly protein, partial [Oscillospiraceae bacterium]|nr:pilus assembly protein [Oscillospiraceae bacterium]